MNGLQAFLAFVRSFGYAIKGIGHGIMTQRNLRVHLTALVTVVAFNCMAGLSVTHWCIELLCCMLVISLELVNTALESVCDQVSTEYQPLIGHAKDAAAGAVLVSAVGAVVIAVLIFFRGGDYLFHVKQFLHRYPWGIAALAAGSVLALIFIFLPAIRQTRKRR